MNRLVGLAVVAWLSGVAGAGAQGKTQKISKNLVNKSKDTVKEIEKVTKQLDKTMKQQSKLLTRAKVKDRQKEHKKLQKELNKTEQAVAKVRKKVDEMEKEADKFFTEWHKGLAAIADEELRAMSKERFDSSRTRYAEIIGTGNLAANQYEEFLRGMKSELSYLDLDLSNEAIVQLGPKTRETAQRAAELELSIADLTRKIEGYMAALQ